MSDETAQPSPIGTKKTPSRHHLGLRRIGNKRHQTVDADQIVTPIREVVSTPQRFPKSASAISEPSAVYSTPQPIESTKKPNDRNCKSTGGIVRKYRLSLNKDIRDKYTRKRLIFQDRHAPPDDKQDSSSNPNLEADYSNLFLLPIEVQISELQKQIADKQQRLLILRNRETEVVAIQADIDTWEAGFRMALEMLCTLRPRFSAQQILHQLGIPDDLVDYS